MIPRVAPSKLRLLYLLDYGASTTNTDLTDSIDLSTSAAVASESTDYLPKGSNTRTLSLVMTVQPVFQSNLGDFYEPHDATKSGMDSTKHIISGMTMAKETAGLGVQ